MFSRALISRDGRYRYELEPENDERAGFWIRHLPVIAAWGSHKAAGPRLEWLHAQLARADEQPRCLGTNKGGSPRHPLYVAHGPRRAKLPRTRTAPEVASV